MTYLIVRLATLGNVAMTVPVIASLSRRYPDDRFIVASKKKLSAMFTALPNVEFREVDNHLGWKVQVMSVAHEEMSRSPPAFC